MKKFEQRIRKLTIPVRNIPNKALGKACRMLSKEIYYKEKPHSIKYIVAMLLNKEMKVMKRRSYMNIYVVGTFKKSYTTLAAISALFARFYLEQGILPYIIPLSNKSLKENKLLLHKLKNGVLLYERE